MICGLSSYYIIFQMMSFGKTRVHTEESTFIDTFLLIFLNISELLNLYLRKPEKLNAIKLCVCFQLAPMVFYLLL